LPVFQNAHRFKPVDAMRELVAATGITKADDIIVYCGTSREASLLFETIKNLLGYPKVRLYEGSMTEWSALSQYPIQTAGKLVQPTPKSATTTGE
jgi:thiosulfate/3-mercaptopyruvate sulfurtransferase